MGPETMQPRILAGFYWVREPSDDYWNVAYICQTHDEPYTMQFTGDDDSYMQPGFIVGPRLLEPPLDTKAPEQV